MVRADLDKRIQALIDTDNKQQEEIVANYKYANGLATDLDLLKTEVKIVKDNKVNQDEFDKEIYDIKDMIAKMNSG
jgi:hypothetical protein